MSPFGFVFLSSLYIYIYNNSNTKHSYAPFVCKIFSTKAFFKKNDFFENICRHLAHTKKSPTA